MLDPISTVRTISLSVDQPIAAVLHQFCHSGLIIAGYLIGFPSFVVAVQCSDLELCHVVLTFPVRSVSKHSGRRVGRFSVQVGPNGNMNSASRCRCPES
jgi:hypothetical protein